MTILDVAMSLGNLAKESPTDGIAPIKECLERVIADEQLRQRKAFAERQAIRSAQYLQAFQQVITL